MIADTDTAELVAELERRGFTVTEKPGTIGYRYTFEHIDRAGDWTGNGAFMATTNPISPDELCARWCEFVSPGRYRVAVYEGAELVACSAVRTIA